MFPTVLFLKERRRRLSDIEFLAIKEFGGKLVKNEGVKDGATGTLATLTASSGKDMYIARAKISLRSSTQTTSKDVKVELQINGTVVETALWVLMDQTSAAQTAGMYNYEFKSIGYKVAATQVIKLEVITLPTNIRVEGFIECFEETTGETPAV